VTLSGLGPLSDSFLCLSHRLAHALARSFNFQGRVHKIFYVLTDDKVGAGPRLPPQALLKLATIDLTEEAMDTDVTPGNSTLSQSEVSEVTEVTEDASKTASQQQSQSASTPSSKLAALKAKRKNTDPINAEAAKSRR